MSSDIPLPKSFIINDDTFYDDKQTIETDLYTAIIYLHRFAKTQINGGFVKVPYFMPSATMRPNAIYSANVERKKYKCKNLFIFKATHNITMDAKYDGELVVELVPTVDTSEKLFLCFLLSNVRYVNREQNDVDKLISISIKPPIHYETMNFNLQNLIEKDQKKIVYKSGIDTVVVFLTPITINEIDFSGYNQITEGMFAIYPVNDNYKIILPSKKEGFQEGLTTEEVINSAFNRNLVTCTPVDDNDQSLVEDNTVTYLAEGGSSSSPQVALGTSFIIILFAISASYIGGPLFFKYAIADYLAEETSLTLFTWFICFMAILLGIILLIMGNQYDSDEMWVGMFILMFTVLSMLSVALNRATHKPETDFSGLADTVSSFRTNFVKVFSKLWYDNNDNFDFYYFGGFFGVLIALIVILAPIAATLDKNDKMNAKEEKKPGYIDHVRGLIMGIGLSYGIIAIIWILLIFKYSG